MGAEYFAQRLKSDVYIKFGSRMLARGISEVERNGKDGDPGIQKNIVVFR